MGTTTQPAASAVSDTGRVGNSTEPAAADHQHPREGFATPTGQNQGAGSAGVAVTVPHSDHAHPFSQWMPLDYGALAWTDDPGTLNGQTTASPVAGTVYLVKLMVPAACAPTSIWMNVATAGVGLTSGQCFAALFSSAGALLQVTADQSGAWNSTGNKQMTISSQALPAGVCYVGQFQNFATSGARFHAGSNGIVAVNFNLSAANSRFATDSTNTGRTTSMPATLGTLAASNNALWAALS
jgi:hypothetical protein